MSQTRAFAASTHTAHGQAQGAELPISDYALIGDCRSAALISLDGSIDWCCWPQFDSPSIFARLIDRSRGGFFQIRPIESFRAERTYLEGTNLLSTTFETGSGRARLIDLMPVMTEEEKRHQLTPFRQILRRVEGIEGELEMEMVFSARPSYGRVARSPQRRDAHHVHGVGREGALDLRATVPLEIDREFARSRFTIRSQERADFALAFTEDAPAVYPVVGELATQEIETSRRLWERWSGRLEYDGPFRDIIARSALLLKLLSFAPSGAIVAAPTTSLPESIGGGRNWDYRYCWLRDASLTADVLYDLGYRVEADAWVQWLMHATRLTHPRLQVLYDVYGEARVEERSLDWLAGYCGSRPVRVGNSAHDQLQLDVYGQVLAAIVRYTEEGGRLDREARSLIEGIVRTVSRTWLEPDHGIWEIREERRQHTHSKAMCWLALDAAIRLAERGLVSGDPSQWRKERERIREWILTRGYDRTIDSFVSSPGSGRTDASLLVMASCGLLDGDDERMVRTIARIRGDLGRGDLVYRYRGVDGLSGDEGCFLACSFWLVSSLAQARRLDEATELFETLIARANDVGLLSEEIDPDTGAFLGNFPQALSHIALIDAALDLQAAERGQRRSRGERAR